MNRAGKGCLGAVLAHPALFLLAFVKGFVLGHAHPRPMSATGGGPVEFLVSGGMNAMGEILVIYIFTAGVAALVVSAIGAMVGAYTA